MNEHIQTYLHNRIAKTPALVDSYLHDRSGKLYLRRRMFDRLMARIEDFVSDRSDIRIVGIPGLRGVGKTTLLAQISAELISRYPKDVLSITMDEISGTLRSSLAEVFAEYEKIMGASFEELRRPVFILIDEIHYDKEWPLVLKTLYDKSKHVFVLCTGSSALSLQATPDLARRILFEKLYPMTFSEYMRLKERDGAPAGAAAVRKAPDDDVSASLKQALLYSESGEACFTELKKRAAAVDDFWFGIQKIEIERYLRFGNMPFALREPDEDACARLTGEIIDRIVERDLPAMGKFKQETLARAKNILLMTAASDEVSLTSFAKNLTDISVLTLADLFDAFEKAELLIRAYPYGSAFKKVRKPSKYLFTSPSIRHALLGIVEGRNAFLKYKGKYLEDIVAMSLMSNAESVLSESLFYDNAKGGADFIVQLGDRKIVLEAGVGTKGTRQAAFTMKRISASYGIVISDGALSFEKTENIINMPIEMFLML